MVLQNTIYKIFNGFVNFNLISLLFLFDWNYLLLCLSSRSICPVGDLPVSWSRAGRASLPKIREINTVSGRLGYPLDTFDFDPRDFPHYQSLMLKRKEVVYGIRRLITA